MPDQNKIDKSRGAPDRGKAGLIRWNYAVSTLAAAVAVFVASRYLPSRPMVELPTIGQMLAGFAAAMAATGVLFGFRLEAVTPRFARFIGWALVLSLGIIVSFAMSVSERFGLEIEKLLGLSGGQPEHLALVEVARAAAVLAAMCVGSVAAFIWSTMLELHKYHTFLCIRLMRVRIINYLVTLAVAGSVFVLIVVLSVLWGFDRDLRSRIRGTLAPVSVEAEGNDRVQDYETLITWIKQLFPHEVTECAPYVQCFVFLKSPMYTTQALVRGVDMEREKKVGDITSYLRNGKAPDFNKKDGQPPPHPGILIGHELVNTIKLRNEQSQQVLTDTEIELDPPLAPPSIEPYTFTVVGEFKTGYLEYDSRFVYVPLRQGQKLAGLGPDEVSGLSIGLSDYRYADTVKDALKKKLTPAGYTEPIYSVKTWAEQRPTLLAAIHLERVVMAVILGSLIVLAGLFVCAVMLMAVKEKTRDIGIVKSVGGTVSGIMEIFLINGFIIGVIGAGVGGTGGLLFVKYINQIATGVERATGITILPRNIYYLDSIPTYIDPVGVGMILCATVAVALLAAMVPSLIAARLNPVESLRYE